MFYIIETFSIQARTCRSTCSGPFVRLLLCGVFTMRGGTEGWTTRFGDVLRGVACWRYPSLRTVQARSIDCGTYGRIGVYVGLLWVSSVLCWCGGRRVGVLCRAALHTVLQAFVLTFLPTTSSYLVVCCIYILHCTVCSCAHAGVLFSGAGAARTALRRARRRVWRRTVLDRGAGPAWRSGASPAALHRRHAAAARRQRRRRRLKRVA